MNALVTVANVLMKIGNYPKDFLTIETSRSDNRAGGSNKKRLQT